MPRVMSPATPDAEVLLAIVAAQTEIVSAALELDAVVDLVCREARTLTGADGAVLEIAGGLTLVRDGAVGDGSMLCVPLVHQGQQLGVLKVTSGAVDAFDDRDQTTLNLLSGLIAAQLLHAQDFEHVAAAALEDGLTNLGNGRAYEERLASEAERAIRHGRALTLALFDIDQLGQINAEHGHGAGDGVLVRVADALRHVRVVDQAYRIAGDRFALLMPETTERQAEIVVRRIQEQLARRDASGLAAPVSIGTSQARHRDPEILHASAAEALARAKRHHAVLRRVA